MQSRKKVYFYITDNFMATSCEQTTKINGYWMSNNWTWIWKNLSDKKDNFFQYRNQNKYAKEGKS